MAPVLCQRLAMICGCPTPGHATPGNALVVFRRLVAVEAWGLRRVPILKGGGVGDGGGGGYGFHEAEAGFWLDKAIVCTVET